MTRFKRALVRETGKTLVQFGFAIMVLVVAAVIIPQLPEWTVPATGHTVLFFLAGLTLWLAGRVLDAWAAIDQAGVEEKPPDSSA